MRAMFLDFDGVLNYAGWMKIVYEEFKDERATSYFERHARELEPSRVKMISDLALETDSAIVVSSSWRILHELHELCDLLKAAGMDERVLPKAATPRSSKGFRGQEVIDWLQANPHYNTYVIFDDDGDFYDGQPLVKTDWNVGLLPSHVEAARKILLNID